jgi:hypothetical protein
LEVEDFNDVEAETEVDYRCAVEPEKHISN